MKTGFAHVGLSAFSIAAMLCMVSGTASSADPRDLSGVWQIPEGLARTFDTKAKSLDTERPPFKPVWAQEWQKTRERARAGSRVWDPTLACLPPGMPRSMAAPYPFEILTTPGSITILFEFYGEIRQIWVDGRSHPGPDDIEPTFSGHSIGQWERDTLVIDTVGLRHETVIDAASVPHSDQMHVVEHVRRVGADKLEWDITLEDPVVFDKPWSTTRTYLRSPAGTDVREYICADYSKPDPYVPTPDDVKYLKPDPRLKTLP